MLTHLETGTIFPIYRRYKVFIRDALTLILASRACIEIEAFDLVAPGYTNIVVLWGEGLAGVRYNRLVSEDISRYVLFICDITFTMWICLGGTMRASQYRDKE